jgi:hypothetical protein
MNLRSPKGNKDLDALDKMIEEITVDSYGDDEKLWAFQQAFEDNVKLPADGFVIGEPVSVIEVDYDGNERRGLTARCRREDGPEHVVAVSEIVFPQASGGANYIAAYRKWLNLDPFPAEVQVSFQRKRQHKVTADDLDLSNPVELVALSVKERAARCRLLESERVTMKSVYASASCPWGTNLLTCCRGAISTTDHFCAVCAWLWVVPLSSWAL